MSFARAANTIKAYDQAWKNFSEWCASTGLCALPATPDTVMNFVAWSLVRRLNRLNTVRQHLAAIRYHHLQNAHHSPINGEVRELMQNAARKLRERPQQKRALTPQQLRQLAAALQSNGSPIARRDHAIILLTFAAGWRCSEILSLSTEDVWFDSDQRLHVQLGASKMDQDGRCGREVSIPRGEHPGTCPVEALRVWLEARGGWPGPLFCCFTGRDGRHMTRKGMRYLTFFLRLKQLLLQIDENPSRYGTHSLRAGMITSAVENGMDALLIMQRTGQKSVATVKRYVRPAEAIRANPLAGVL